MAITINLKSSSGVSFNSELKDFLSNFQTDGWPLILGGSDDTSGSEVVLTGPVTTGAEALTETVVLDGADFSYYFAEHILSGTLDTLSLGILGDAYNSKSGNLNYSSNGHVSGVDETIEISGLGVTNAYGVRGALHNLISALMGYSSGTSALTQITDLLAANAQILNGSEGADRYTGGKYADVIRGNGGNDTLSGAGGNDKIYGGIGQDTLYGGSGNDRLDGGSGADKLYGGTGNDTYVVSSASDRVIESAGAGTDTVRASASFSLSSNVENLTLTGSHAINGTGNSLANKIYGNEAANTLKGGSGTDTLSGNGGNDKLYGGSGSDKLMGGNGNDKLYGDSGNDKLYGNAGADALKGDAGNDTLSGGAGSDKLYGGDGKDSLEGGSGNDTLSGGAGADKLYGGTGRDTLIGGSGADTFIYRSVAESTVKSTGRDTINDFSVSSGDVISLSAIDANSKVSGNQSFTFISNDAFSDTAGELRYFQSGASTYVQADTNGDGSADLSVRLLGTLTLTQDDFIL